MRFVRDADPALVKRWTSIDAFVTGPDTRPDGPEEWTVHNYRRLSDGLLISRPFDVWRDVLVPRTGEVEWELWTFGKEGAYAYASFAAALRAVLAKPSAMPAAELVDVYLAEAERGDLRALRPLAELGDPRVVELCRATLSDESLDEMSRRMAVHVISLLADPAFLPDLRTAYAHAADSAYRISLLGALKACRDPALQQIVGSAAEDNDESVRRWALRELQEPRS